MEGALDAMNSGKVDRNWAKEHHGLWVKEEDQKLNHLDQKIDQLKLLQNNKNIIVLYYNFMQ